METSQERDLSPTDRSDSTGTPTTRTRDRDPGGPEARLEEIEKQARQVREYTSSDAARLSLDAIKESVDEVRDELGITVGDE